MLNELKMMKNLKKLLKSLVYVLFFFLVQRQKELIRLKVIQILQFMLIMFFLKKKKISLAFELSLILETENIDLVDIKIAPPMLKRKIFENYKILYLKESSILYQIELSTLKEYEEVKILYEIRDERIKEFLIDR